mgnify:CR=1 FL=1
MPDSIKPKDAGKYPSSFDLFLFTILIILLLQFFQERGVLEISFYEWWSEIECVASPDLTETYCEEKRFWANVNLIALASIGFIIIIRTPLFEFLNNKSILNRGFENWAQNYNNFCEKVREKANNNPKLLEHLNSVIGSGLENLSPNFSTVVNKIDEVLGVSPTKFISEFKKSEYFLKYQKILSNPMKLNYLQRRAYFVLINEILKLDDWH